MHTSVRIYTQKCGFTSFYCNNSVPKGTQQWHMGEMVFKECTWVPCSKTCHGTIKQSRGSLQAFQRNNIWTEGWVKLVTHLSFGWWRLLRVYLGWVFLSALCTFSKVPHCCTTVLNIATFTDQWWRCRFHMIWWYVDYLLGWYNAVASAAFNRVRTSLRHHRVVMKLDHSFLFMNTS